MSFCKHHESGVRAVISNEQGSFPPRDEMAGEEDGKTCDRGGDHYGDIESESIWRHGDPFCLQKAGETKHRQDIEDVAADDISHRNISLSTNSGNHGRSDLGK